MSGWPMCRSALILVVSVTVFQVPVRGSIPLLLFALGVFIACNLAMGFAFSTMARTQMQAQQLAQFGLLPSIMLSGLHVPVPGHAGLGTLHRRGGAADARAAHLPRHSAEGQRTGGYLPDLWPMALFAVVAGTIAVCRTARRWIEGTASVP